jgi:hypothetical protein
MPDFALRWIAVLRQTAPTVAIAAISSDAEGTLRDTIGDVAPSSCALTTSRLHFLMEDW